MAKKKDYEDIDSFLNDLKSNIDDVLSKEVLDEVRDIELKYIHTDVLSRYQPKIYKRRSSGGIDDPRNIVGWVKNMELEVENVTPFNLGYGTYNRGNNLADLINEGEGGKSGLYYDFTGDFIQPTHFLDNTQWEVDKTNRMEKILNKGLKHRGYDIRQ